MDALKEVMYAGGICRKIGNEVAGIMDYRVVSLYLCLPNWVMCLCLVPVGTLIPLIFCSLDSGKTRSFNLRKESKGKPDEAGLKLSENRKVVPLGEAGTPQTWGWASQGRLHLHVLAPTVVTTVALKLQREGLLRDSSTFSLFDK